MVKRYDDNDEDCDLFNTIGIMAMFFGIALFVMILIMLFGSEVG